MVNKNKTGTKFVTDYSIVTVIKVTDSGCHFFKAAIFMELCTHLLFIA